MEVLPAVTVLGEGKTEPVLEIVIVEPFVVKLYSVALTVVPPETEMVPEDAVQLEEEGGYVDKDTLGIEQSLLRFMVITNV